MKDITFTTAVKHNTIVYTCMARFFNTHGIRTTYRPPPEPRAEQPSDGKHFPPGNTSPLAAGRQAGKHFARHPGRDRLLLARGSDGEQSGAQHVQHPWI